MIFFSEHVLNMNSSSIFIGASVSGIAVILGLIFTLNRSSDDSNNTTTTTPTGSTVVLDENGYVRLI